MPRAACARPPISTSRSSGCCRSARWRASPRRSICCSQHRDGRVLVIGDFDADGATSTALMVRALRAWGFASVDFLVPESLRVRLRPDAGDRGAGARRARRRSSSRSTTASRAIAGVAAARARGIEVLITDHHLPGAELPAANVIVNPNLPGSRFGSRALAGVGVAFYVMAALQARARRAAGLTPPAPPASPSFSIWSRWARSPMSCRSMPTTACWSRRACGASAPAAASPASARCWRSPARGAETSPPRISPSPSRRASTRPAASTT